MNIVPIATRELLIVWWSRTGASEQLALAAFEAASQVCAAAPGGGDDSHATPVVVRRMRCDRVTPADLLQAQAYLFVAPENLGSLAGMMKEFFDRSYYPALGRVEGRPYGLIVSAGSDGQGAVRQLTRIVTGWRLRAVAEPLIVNLAAQTPEQILAPKTVLEPELRRAAELGELLAQGLQMGVW